MYLSQYIGVCIRSKARKIRARDKEIETPPTDFSSLNQGMERANRLDKFTSIMQAVSSASKKLNSTSFPTLHTKQSYVISELGSGAAINTHVIKNYRSYFK